MPMPAGSSLITVLGAVVVLALCLLVGSRAGRAVERAISRDHGARPAAAWPEIAGALATALVGGSLILLLL